MKKILLIFAILALAAYPTAILTQNALNESLGKLFIPVALCYIGLAVIARKRIYRDNPQANRIGSLNLFATGFIAGVLLGAPLPAMIAWKTNNNTLTIIGIIATGTCAGTFMALNKDMRSTFKGNSAVYYTSSAITSAIIPIALIMAFALFMVTFVEHNRYNKRKPTEFFQIEKQSPDSSYKKESFVVANPPKDTTAIREKIEAFNRQTIQMDSMKKHSLNRYFYRETRCLSRNFEEGKPYPKTPWWANRCNYYGNDPGQQVRYHPHDKLIVTRHYITTQDPTHIQYYYVFGEAATDSITTPTRTRIKTESWAP
jgi:hypothetical protein